MPAAAQILDNLRCHTALQPNLLAGNPLPARSVKCSLRIQQPVHRIHNHLHMALRLHIRAHNAERPHSLALMRQKSGDNRMIRLLARCQIIIKLRIQAEACATVIKVNAIAGQHDAAAKILIIALDERNHIALAVSSTQINSAAAERLAMRRLQRRLANQRTPLRSISVAQQLLHPRLHITRVSDIVHAVGKRQLHRLNLLMEGVARILRADFHILQNVQRHERRNAMTVRRHLPHVIAVVIDMHRLHPFRAVISQILQGKIAARLVAELHQLLRQLTAIIALAIAVRQNPQRFRMVRQRNQLARLRRYAIAMHIKGREPRRYRRIIFIRRESVYALLPKARHNRRNRIALLRIINCRLKKLRKGQTAKALMQLCPGRGRTGNRHSLPAAQRHPLRRTAGSHSLRRQALRSIAAAVQTMQLAARPHERKAVAAKAIVRRLHNRLADSRSNRRINRVAALLQNRQACLRSKRLRGADHAALRMNYATARSVFIFLCIKSKVHIIPPI